VSCPMKAWVLLAWVAAHGAVADDREPAVLRLRPHLPPEVDASALTRFDPTEELRTGAAFIVCPGGDYVAVDPNADEGRPIAQWLARLGITAFVLRYRTVPEGHRWPAQLEDVELALRTVRGGSAEAGLDPRRVGVMGFSAGGHLASSAATRSDSTWRPDLQVLLYPTIDTTKPDWWPWDASAGWPAPTDSTHLHVSPSTPPAFVVCSTEDDISTDTDNCSPYVTRLRAARVPVEHFVRPMGQHGFHLCGGWTDACVEWLAERQWIAPLPVGDTGGVTCDGRTVTTNLEL